MERQGYCGISPNQSVLSDCLALTQNRANFDKSAVPARIMFMGDDGNWTDFPLMFANALRSTFVDRDTTVKIEALNAYFLIDFHKMLRIDLRAMHERSIAWIDINGRCFFPKLVFGGEDGSNTTPSFNFKIKLKFNEVEGLNKVKEEPSENRANSSGDGDRVEGREMRHIEGTERSGDLCDQEGASRETADCIPDFDRTGVTSDCLALTQNRANFDKSAVPARIMFIGDDGNWTDFPPLVADVLRRTFADRITSVKIEAHNACFLIDFHKMLQIDLRAMHERSIAWIDINMRCFFPKMVFGGEDGFNTTSPFNLKIKLKFNELEGLNKVKEEPSENRANSSGDGDQVEGRERRHIEGIERTVDLCDQENFGASRETVTCISDFDRTGVTYNMLINLIVNEMMAHRTANDNLANAGGKDVVNRVLGKRPMDVGQSQRGRDGDRDMMKGVFSSKLPKIGTSSDKSVSMPIKKKPDFDSKLVKLEESHMNHIMIKNLFLDGMRKIDLKANVTSIYWCSHSDLIGNVRLQAFLRSVEKTRVSRGDANVRYAWHAASPMAIESTVLHCFGQTEAQSSAENYGIGINLSAMGYSQMSVFQSGPDDDGEFYVVLCRVILGNMEEIKLGSLQFQPSSNHFDSGVDSLRDPKYHIIWGTHMNTHILPEFVVSFRVSEHPEDLWRRRSLIRDFSVVPMCLGTSREVSRHDSSSQVQAVLLVPVHHHPSMYAQGQGNARFLPHCTIPDMSYPALFFAMRGHLSCHIIEMLESVYNDFKAGKIEQEVLIGIIRSIAGDEVLTAAINNIYGQGCSKT